MARSCITKTAFSVTWLALVMASAAFGGIEVFPIARAAKDQQYPAIDDCTVAWQDNRYDDWDIAVADISHPGGVDAFTFADIFSEAQYPAVCGDIVVWQNKYFLYEDWDIAGLDLSREEFFDIVATDADECRPAISGNLVVAETRVTMYADWDVIGIDISRRNAPQPFWIDASAADQSCVDIHGDIVVYQDTYGGRAYICGWDLSDLEGRTWFPLYGSGDAQQTPAIYGKWVVWLDDIEGRSVIGGDNIFHPALAQVWEPDEATEPLNPDVYNNVVVWQDRRNGNWDIYGCNLTTRQVFPIATHLADQSHPAITFSPSLNRYVVVWQDDRNGNWDIYGALIDGPEVAGCASPLKGDVNADSVVDANDLDEVQDRLGQRNGIPIDED